MAPQAYQVVYKPDSQSTDEYIVFIDQVDEYKKWKEGDTSIALALVVGSFDIFHSGQGSQGVLGKISKQQMETVFDTKNEDEAVKKLLEKGELKATKDVHGMPNSKNDHRGGANINTRGTDGGLRG